MKFFEKKSVIKIAEDDLKDAKLSSMDYSEDSVKKRAFIDVLGARLAMKFLFSQKIEANNIYSLYTIHNVLEELDLSDIYYQGIKIDVRLVFDKNEIFIPRKHFEYDLLPDLYIVLCIKEDLSSADFLGFFEPKNLDRTNANKDFYFCEYENLVKPDKLKTFLDNFKKVASDIEVTQELLQNNETLFLSLVDKEITKTDKILLYKQLANSFELREKAIEFENFEIISRAIAKNGTMLNDDMLKIVASSIDEDSPETETIQETIEDNLDTTQSVLAELDDELTEDELMEIQHVTDFVNEQAKEESNKGMDTALIAGGAIVAAAGLRLAAEAIKGTAGATAAAAETQGAIIAGAAGTASAAIELGSGFFDNLSGTKNETTIDELPDFDDFTQNDLDDEFPDFENIEEPKIEENFESEDDSDLFEITESNDMEQVEEISLDENELPDFETADSEVEETADVEEESTTGTPTGFDLHDLEAMEDEEDNTKNDEPEVQNETDLFNLDGISDFEPIDETAINELHDFEAEEDETEDNNNELSGIDEATEVEDLEQEVTGDDELPSFHDLVQKSVEEDGLPDFEYLVQNSLEETELPDFEHLVQENAGESEVNDEEPEEANLEIEELPEIEATPSESSVTEDFAIDEDLPTLNLKEIEPLEDLLELKEFNESDSETQEEVNNSEEEVFNLDNFDFNLLEEDNETAEADESENDIPSIQHKEEITNFEDLKAKEASEIEFDDDSDDFISQVDDFLGEVELSDEQRSILEQTLLADDDMESTQKTTPATNESVSTLPESIYPQADLEFVQDEEDDKDLLKVLFEKEKIDNLPDLEQEPEEEVTPSTTNALKNKKMVIAASIAGVVLVSFVIGGSITSSQNSNANLPQNVATTATPVDGQLQPTSTDMTQAGTPMDGQMNNQMPGQAVQSMPGEDQQVQTNRDMGKAVSDAFTSDPVNASISKIAWEVPEDLAYNDSFRKYLQIAGKNLKLNLQNDLLLATEMAYSNKVIVDLKIAQDGSLQSENITVSSGSKQIDKIVLQSVKETLKYLKMPSSELGSGSVGATLIINF